MTPITKLTITDYILQDLIELMTIQECYDFFFWNNVEFINIFDSKINLFNRNVLEKLLTANPFLIREINTYDPYLQIMTCRINPYVNLHEGINPCFEFCCTKFISLYNFNFNKSPAPSLDEFYDFIKNSNTFKVNQKFIIRQIIKIPSLTSYHLLLLIENSDYENHDLIKQHHNYKNNIASILLEAIY